MLHLPAFEQGHAVVALSVIAITGSSRKVFKMVPRVIQCQNHKTVVGYPVCICDAGPDLRQVRSVKMSLSLEMRFLVEAARTTPHSAGLGHCGRQD
jgi:hypothetical protein